MKRLVMSFLVLASSACTTTGQRIDELAQHAGLGKAVFAGGSYRHVIYMRATPPPGARVFVFLDGDGRPWGSDGLSPAADPTTRNPLALKLLATTPADGAYVSRPCYQQLLDAQCTPDVWTSGRYSESVVSSMTAAIRDVIRRAGARDVVLVGYSGGGALAVLVAERLDDVAAVVTIAANLDTDTWTAHHNYLPLSASLNPARSDRSHPWPEIHLNGARDVVVPSETRRAYFDKYPAAQRWTYDTYDHVCCWVENWPGIYERITQALMREGYGPRATGDGQK
jgi:dienelactone hydrolase